MALKAKAGVGFIHCKNSYLCQKPVENALEIVGSPTIFNKVAELKFMTKTATERSELMSTIENNYAMRITFDNPAWVKL